MQQEVIALEEAGNLLHPTGSRLICPEQAKSISDWDVYILAEKERAEEWLKAGQFTSPVPESGSYRKSASFRRRFMCGGELNLIVFFDATQYQRFHDATVFCADLKGPTDRDKRIELFKKFLDGAAPMPDSWTISWTMQKGTKDIEFKPITFTPLLIKLYGA